MERSPKQRKQPRKTSTAYGSGTWVSALGSWRKQRCEERWEGEAGGGTSGIGAGAFKILGSERRESRSGCSLLNGQQRSTQAWRNGSHSQRLDPSSTSCLSEAKGLHKPLCLALSPKSPSFHHPGLRLLPHPKAHDPPPSSFSLSHLSTGASSPPRPPCATGSILSWSPQVCPSQSGWSQHAASCTLVLPCRALSPDCWLQLASLWGE